MADIAYDLLGDLERADRAATPGTRAEDRFVAAIMRRRGFSDADIAATLGIGGSEAGLNSAGLGGAGQPAKIAR